ncbi:unnamed protein product [Cylindrotheca closterium]|uniref:ORC1/DEAH AAA+ ATPase domain-containing protein n=1 Tax=Cylindrotheca closterium TaxID=2856 RepID=A0AAD2CRR3_9STRA|nr:unnamed protein product [Cylindrotheca closterium]
MAAPQNAKNEDDSNAKDGLGKLQNDDSNKNYKGNRKPIQRTDPKDDDDTGGTKSSRNSQETTDIVPPDDEKTLGDYMANEDEWFKDDVTDIEKKTSKSQLIEALKVDEDYFKPTQMRLTIDLAHFLKTGESRPSISKTAAAASQRVTDIDYDIRDSKMVYKRDLKAFAARLDKLFEWKNIHSKEYMAPYFPLIQSSGTGKTKLMHEYKNLMTMDKADVHVELILCTDGNEAKIASAESIFSQILDIREIQSDQNGLTKLWNRLNRFADTEKKKVVLLFDESQHLTSNSDGWHFRSVRWWLRWPNKPGNVNVVCVFAGTTTRLANYYAEPKPSTTSRDANVVYLGGDKLYPPFYQLTTTGLVSRTDGFKFGTVGGTHKTSLQKKNETITELDVAIQYGRPLFGRLYLKGQLKTSLGNILLRMRGADQELSLQKYYSLLATRLQMGQVSFDFASELVASGYAHLTHFSPDQTAVAGIAFLPDPVCAWLAMTQMIEGCNRFGIDDGIPTECSEPASVWSEKAIKIFSSALCRPAKGDVGEVAAAFYMLACGDELRFEQSTDLTQLSVPLEKWIARLQHADLNTTLNLGEAKASVNFIQVCQNYLRYSLKEMQDSGLLKHWYLGGRGSYMYFACAAYDIMVPVQYTVNGTLHYCPMLVSVKNKVEFWPYERKAAIKAMQKLFTDAGIQTGVCLLLLIGLDNTSGKKTRKKTKSGNSFGHGQIFTVTVVVPKEDRFGATNLALCSTCGGGQESEVMVSHAELALGADHSFDCLLRKKNEDDGLSQLLFEEIREGYANISIDEDDFGGATAPDESRGST